MAPLALQEITLAIWLIVKGFAEHIVADADGEPAIVTAGVHHAGRT